MGLDVCLDCVCFGYLRGRGLVYCTLHTGRDNK